MKQRHEQQRHAESDDRHEDEKTERLQSGPQRQGPTHCLEFASVYGILAEDLLDPQQLVVLANAVGATQRAGLDLAGVGRPRDVRNRRVLCLARAMADDRRVTASFAISIASRVSVSEPIWLTFTRIELAVPVSIPA